MTWDRAHSSDRYQVNSISSSFDDASKVLNVVNRKLHPHSPQQLDVIGVGRPDTP